MPTNEAETQNNTILIIDDDWMNRELLSTMLEVEDFTVLEASNGQKGLQITTQKRPALVILDVRMPDMDGYTVCRKIKENPDTQAIPVLMISGLDHAEERQTALDAGAVTLLNRFMPLEDMVATVRKHLSNSP